MSKFKVWVHAARLRTLPLSISGIIVGTAIANAQGYSNWKITILALLTTVGLQVTSNFANDYGDGIKGTDNEDRVGPKRALQSGLLTVSALKKGIIFSVLINIILIIALIFIAFGKENIILLSVFLFLGLASIVAAIKYTVGKSAYGYSGLGDVFVFLFFGLLSVVGTYFLFTKKIEIFVFLPAIGIGVLSTAVLNLNNMRDRSNDMAVGKNTLVVKLGDKKARIYHFALLSIALISFAMFNYFNYQGLQSCIFYIGFIFIVKHFFTVLNIKINKNYDPELKKVALTTFLIAVLFYSGYNIFL